MIDPTYYYTPYPKVLYHATLSATVVADKDEHAALGAGWTEDPDSAQLVLESSGVPCGGVIVTPDEYAAVLAHEQAGESCIPQGDRTHDPAPAEPYTPKPRSSRR